MKLKVFIVEAGFLAGFARVVDMFDGGDDQAVAAARGRWKRCRAQGLTLAYWQQGQRGGWERKA